MLSNMACSLIEHKRINTTVAKAKALRRFVEPILTKSKNDTTHSRRTVFSTLQSKNAVSELFREVAPKIAERPGGYTRIIKTGFRPGDSAEMCMIELVDFNEIYVTEGKTAAKGKTRRSRRGGTPKAKAETAPKADAAKEETAEAAAPEAAPEAKAETKPETAPEAGEEKTDNADENTDKKEESN